MDGQLCKIWDGLYVSPSTAASNRAKLGMSFAWVLRPSQLTILPKFEIAMHPSRQRLLM